MAAMSLAEFSAMLARAARNVRPELVKDATEIGVEQHSIAYKMIGQEMPEWPPLAERTIEEKERLGYTGQVSETDPLLRTGEMRDTIEARVTTTPGGVQLEVGSKDKVALYQEMGTALIPPRPFLAMSAIEVMPFAEKTITRTVTEIFTKKD